VQTKTPPEAGLDIGEVHATSEAKFGSIRSPPEHPFTFCFVRTW